MKMHFDTEARTWTEALPLGNGRIGAMVFGGINEEKIQLNEDTLWSGGPSDWNNPKAKEALPHIRKQIAEGNYEQAEQISKATMMGPYTQSYLPLGTMHIQFYHGSFVENYRRELDLRHGISTVEYEIGQVKHKREVFVSEPDQVMVMRLITSEKGMLDFKIYFSSPLSSTQIAEKDRLILCGKAPDTVWPNYYPKDQPVVYEENSKKTIHFSGKVQVKLEGGGSYSVENDGIHVKNASSVLLYFSAATSFNGADKCPGTEGKEYKKIAHHYLRQAMKKSYRQLLENHQQDHRELFDRVQLSLGDVKDESSLPLHTRIKEFGAKDPYLIELLFQYGRYLLIASSREGTQPANLQGIWNKDIRPIWSSNYTLNINAQMNYWPAEITNLSECHHPFLDFIEELAENGRVTAEVNYGCRGWLAHHNSDIWRQSAPAGDYGHGNPLWANWPMAAPWLCRHIWEHYLFNLDESFLKRMYPTIRDSALFCYDWLIENKAGYLVTSPSTSPEHRFIAENGYVAALSEGSTMDLSLIWEVFTISIQAMTVLDVEDSLKQDFEQALERLLPPQIGQYGQLQEWSKDFADEDQFHRHVSHLYGVYPGFQITENNPELFEAAKTSLIGRGNVGTGWSIAWKINLWARFKESELALEALSHLMQLVKEEAKIDFHKGGVYGNLLVAHPPFQIDGNFGATAGIGEMLLQSHASSIEILPALPKQWSKGYVKGLKARGGFVINIEWDKNQPIQVEINSLKGNLCQMKLTNRLKITNQGQEIIYRKKADSIIEFATNKHETYTISFKK